MSCCTHTCTFIRSYSGVSRTFAPSGGDSICAPHRHCHHHRAPESSQMVLMVLTRPFVFNLSQGGSWNHSEVLREADETSSSSGTETWTSVSYCSLKQLLLRQEHTQGCFLCFLLADIADFFSFVLLFWINLYTFSCYWGTYRRLCDYRVMSVILDWDVNVRVRLAGL